MIEWFSRTMAFVIASVLAIMTAMVLITGVILTYKALLWAIGL